VPPEIEGRSYGPVSVGVGSDSIARFVAATRDDPQRWAGAAPPSFAAAALFAVAPLFLADPDVVARTRSLIHIEQLFEWHRGLEVGEQLQVEGRVAGVRARRSLTLVTFAFEGVGEAGRWVDGEATFLLSDEAAGSSAEEPEPVHDERGVDERPVPTGLPAPGEDIPEMFRSADRTDLVRYAGATGDWNPIHWDHAAAVAAGLPGVIVHGLLMASWLAQAAARHAPGADPLRRLQLRFRKPLRPGIQAQISGRVSDAADGFAEIGLRLAAEGTDLVTGTALVTA
jgi:acyl dehydratase